MSDLYPAANPDMLTDAVSDAFAKSAQNLSKTLDEWDPERSSSFWGWLIGGATWNAKGALNQHIRNEQSQSSGISLDQEVKGRPKYDGGMPQTVQRPDLYSYKPPDGSGSTAFSYQADRNLTPDYKGMLTQIKTTIEQLKSLPMPSYEQKQRLSLLVDQYTELRARWMDAEGIKSAPERQRKMYDNVKGLNSVVNRSENYNPDEFNAAVKSRSQDMSGLDDYVLQNASLKKPMQQLWGQQSGQVPLNRFFTSHTQTEDVAIHKIVSRVMVQTMMDMKNLRDAGGISRKDGKKVVDANKLKADFIEAIQKKLRAQQVPDRIIEQAAASVYAYSDREFMNRLLEPDEWSRYHQLEKARALHAKGLEMKAIPDDLDEQIAHSAHDALGYGQGVPMYTRRFNPGHKTKPIDYDLSPAKNVPNEESRLMMLDMWRRMKQGKQGLESAAYLPHDAPYFQKVRKDDPFMPTDVPSATAAINDEIRHVVAMAKELDRMGLVRIAAVSDSTLKIASTLIEGLR